MRFESAQFKYTQRDRGLDQFKGMLICLIVLGHNYFFSANFPKLFSFIYGFHVISFLLIPFLFLAPKFGQSSAQRRTDLCEKLIRILVPHLWFLALAASIFCALNIVLGSSHFFPWLRDLFVALLVQQETNFRATVGTGLLWFLPAYALQAVLIWRYRSFDKLQRRVVILLAFTWHLVFGATPVSNNPLPWSFSLVSYLFVIGLLVGEVNRRMNWNRILDLALVVIWVVCSFLVIEQRFFHTLAGDIRAPVSIMNPLELLLQDGFIVLSFFALMRFASRIPIHFLEVIGRHSLQIFLIHSFVWQILWRVFFNRVEYSGLVIAILTTGVSFGLTLLISFAGSKLIEISPLQRWIFPRSIFPLRA